MTEKKMIYTQLLSLPCMIYENGSEQNTCTKLVNMSSTCISWLAQSCFPSAPPCLWIQTWEIFRIQTCFEALIIHCPSKHNVGMCGFWSTSKYPTRWASERQYKRRAPRIWTLDPEFSMELWHLCCEGSLGSYEESAISNGSSSVHDTCH